MIRKQLAIAQTALDTAFELLESEQKDEECRHPEEARKDYSTMGITRWQCGKCGFMFEESEVR